MKKKLLMYFLMLMLAFSFAACSSDDDDSSSKRSERGKDDEDDDDEDEDEDEDDKEDKKDKDKDKDKDDDEEKSDDEDEKSDDEDEKSEDEDEDDKKEDDKKPSFNFGDGELSENLFDFQFSIDGEVYALPMWYEEFEDLGWYYEGDPDLKLASEDYDYDVFEKDGVELWVDVTNYSINATKVKDCIVTGVEFDGYDLDDDTVIKFAKDIQLEVSTPDDIIAAYGEPSDIYEGSYRTYYYYYPDDDYYYYQEITFSFDNETGIFDRAEFSNEVEEIDGFDNTLNLERPDFLDNYEAPTALSDDIYGTEISVDGDIYTLPCPVTEFYKNGYELQYYYDEDYLPAGQTYYCSLEKEGKELSVHIKNFSDYATSFDNCYVVSVSYDSAYHGDIAYETAGGITIGMTEDELVAAFGDLENSLYESDEQNYYYLYENVWEYSNSRSYTTTNGVLTAIEVSCDKSPVE